MIAKKKRKNPVKGVKDLPAKKVTDKEGRDVKGGMPQGPPNRQIPPGPPI
jgi:hypothetical protein